MTDEVTSRTDKIPRSNLVNRSDSSDEIYAAYKLGLEKGKEIERLKDQQNKIDKRHAVIEFKSTTLAPAVKELLWQCDEIKRQLMLERRAAAVCLVQDMEKDILALLDIEETTE
jgi:hypothetical protein